LKTILRIRPSNETTYYSSESIKWRSSRTINCAVLRCTPLDQSVSANQETVFFSRTEKLKFPQGENLRHEIVELERRAKTLMRINETTGTNYDYVLPGHNCYIYPAIRIKNLLPLDVGFNLSDEQTGTILPHKSEEIYYYPNQLFLKLNLEGFLVSPEICLPRDRQVLVEAKISDHLGRILILLVKLQVEPSIVISISAKYWLVNHTSLPLVFRQKDAHQAAGQFDDHEEARCRTPLLFSYSDSEAPPYCQVRLGKKLSSKFIWSSEFPLEDECHRELQSDSCMYYIGISGKDTNLVPPNSL